MPNEVIITEDSRPYKSLITDIGNAKMTRAVLEGRKVNIVEMRLGDGGGEYYMPTTAATALVNEVWRGEIASKTINEQSPNIIAVKTVLPSTIGGFTIREASLHDDEGDMIAICNMPAIPKATLPDGISSSLDVVMNILLSNVDAVEFIINPTLDPASRDDLQQAIAAHNADPNAHGGATGGAKVNVADVTIPKEGWAAVEPSDTESGGMYVDVHVEGVTETMIPDLSIYQADMETARKCGMSTSVRTLDGSIRVYAQVEPAAEIRASLALFGAGGSGGNSGFTVQPATRTTPGIVIIGDGVDVDQAGKISVDGHGIVDDMVAPKEDVTEMLDGVFGPKEG